MYSLQEAMSATAVAAIVAVAMPDAFPGNVSWQWPLRHKGSFSGKNGYNVLLAQKIPDSVKFIGFFIVLWPSDSSGHLTGTERLQPHTTFRVLTSGFL